MDCQILFKKQPCHRIFGEWQQNLCLPYSQHILPKKISGTPRGVALIHNANVGHTACIRKKNGFHAIGKRPVFPLLLRGEAFFSPFMGMLFLRGGGYFCSGFPKGIPLFGFIVC
ncbi:MAG: hypothetical protein J6S82_07985 [Bacteroidales bacterium]|nr:hypothetical protein [Bacteroidales bacterium]